MIVPYPKNFKNQGLATNEVGHWINIMPTMVEASRAIMCFMLLINIVFTAIFSAVSNFQKFGFEQPNIAIVNFPFSWLATFIVPMVLFGHLASIRILLKNR